MKIGTFDFTAGRVGTAPVARVMLGSVQVWPSLAGDSVAPTFNSIVWNQATQTLDVDGFDDIDTAPDIYVASVDSGSGTPGQAEMEAGTGGGIIEAFTQLNTTGLVAQDLGFTGASDAADRIYVMLKDDAGNVTIDFLSVVIDQTTPTITLPVGTANGANGATWSVTSNEPDGTIFAAIRLATDPALSKADIQAGTGNAIATDTDATPTADANNGGSFTGLTAGTEYAIDMFQIDAESNESLAVISTANFTTDAISAFIALTPKLYVNGAPILNINTDIEGLQTSGDDVVLTVCAFNNTGSDAYTIDTVTNPPTLGGNPMTVLQDVFGDTDNVFAFRAPHPGTDTATIDFSLVGTGTGIIGYVIGAYKIDGMTGFSVVTSQNANPNDLSTAVLAGDIVMATGVASNSSAWSSFVGFTPDPVTQIDLKTNEHAFAGSALVGTSETRTVTASSGNTNNSALLVRATP